MKKFFLSNALEFGIEGIQITRVPNAGSKYRSTDTFKITDTITGVEYFIRSGECGYGWCTYSTGYRCRGGDRRRGVKQYNVMSFRGSRRELDLQDSIQVVERHIARKRK